MWWLGAMSAAWPCSGPPTLPELAWPWIEAPLDAVVVVARPGDLGELGLRDADGASVPVVAYAIGDHAILDPEDDLVPGVVYTLTWSGRDGRSFTATDRVAGSGGAPVPVTRELQTSLDYEDAPCGGGDVSVDTVHYRLCSTADVALYLVAEGEDEPPPVLLSAPGAVRTFDDDTVELAEVFGLGEGDGATLWFGAFDGAGRFMGWTGPEVLVMPPDDHREATRMPAAEGGSGTTPDAFTACPPFGPWEEPRLEYCPTVDKQPECGPVPAPACGCAAPGAGGGAAGALLALVWITGRSAGRGPRPTRGSPGRSRRSRAGRRRR